MNNHLMKHSALKLFAAIAISWSASSSAALIDGYVDSSPISIPTGSVTHTTLPAMNFALNTVDLTVLNTGSPDIEKSIKATPITAGGTMSFTGDVGNSYNLLQFHFHTPSENLLDGVEEDMEIHMVFGKNGDGTPALVVGRLIQIGAINTLLDPIFSQLGSAPLNTALGSTQVNGFDLTGLLPATLESYRFTGSLTTSPYSGPIQWIVLNERMYMSQTQVDSFRALFNDPLPQGGTGNSREVQTLNGRLIQTDVQGTVPEPDTISLLLIGFSAIGWNARRRKFSAVAQAA